MFSGAGGSSHGAANASAIVLGGVDLCPIAAQTFQDNFAGATVFNRRVEDLSPRTVLNKIGEIDLLLASPECTNHSCARGARPRMEASRETAMQVLRFAAVMKPRWIVIENVIHMRPWRRYVELLDRLKDLGYDVAEHVLDSADFGVPQRRQRLFLLCDREDSAPQVVKKRPGPKPVARTILRSAGDLGGRISPEQDPGNGDTREGTKRDQRSWPKDALSTSLLWHRWQRRMAAA